MTRPLSDSIPRNLASLSAGFTGGVFALIAGINPAIVGAITALVVEALLYWRDAVRLRRRALSHSQPNLQPTEDRTDEPQPQEHPQDTLEDSPRKAPVDGKDRDHSSNPSPAGGGSVDNKPIPLRGDVGSPSDPVE